MTARQYKRISAPFRDEKRARALRLFNTLVTRLCYAAYPVLLIVLAVRQDGRFLRALLVPAIAFALVTVVRCVFFVERPDELLVI